MRRLKKIKKGSPYDLSNFAWVCDKCGKIVNQTGAPEMGAMIGKYCHCNKKKKGNE